MIGFSAVQAIQMLKTISAKNPSYIFIPFRSKDWLVEAEKTITAGKEAAVGE